MRTIKFGILFAQISLYWLILSKFRFTNNLNPVTMRNKIILAVSVLSILTSWIVAPFAFEWIVEFYKGYGIKKPMIPMIGGTAILVLQIFWIMHLVTNKPFK